MRSVVDVPARETGLTDEQKEHLCGVLRPIVNERFGGNATQAAKAMRLTQPQLSQILLGKKSARSAGVSALVRIRAFVGMSLDDLLGLPPLRVVVEPTAAGDEFTSRYKAALAELEQIIERQRTTISSVPPSAGTQEPDARGRGLPRARRRP
jgi:transcriptional regulator with XRE-family HTH domain